jgi:hypothetical protein
MMLHEDYDRRCSIEKNSVRESQGAYRQDELIHGKPPVVKWLWLWPLDQNGASPRQSWKKGLAEDLLWIKVVYCDYQWLYKEWSTNPIQNQSYKSSIHLTILLHELSQ